MRCIPLANEKSADAMAPNAGAPVQSCVPSSSQEWPRYWSSTYWATPKRDQVEDDLQMFLGFKREGEKKERAQTSSHFPLNVIIVFNLFFSVKLFTFSSRAPVA